MPVTVSDPLVDIVMLVHDKSEWADLAVRAVEAFTKNPYRLIVVDSGSREATTHMWLEWVERRGHLVVKLAENRSFSAGVNAGVIVGAAQPHPAPFICVLNDDAIVTEGWDTALLQDAADKSVGLVGARSNYASGAQGDPSFIGDPPYLVFVCVAMRRQVWESVGPMDGETFDGFSSEDIDYSWRVRKAGLKLKVSSAFVLHAGSRTLGATIGAFTDPDCTQTTEARRRNDAKYNARLVEKWGKEWAVKNSQLQQRGFVVTFHAEEWTRVAFMGSLMGLRRSDGIGFQYHHMTRAPIQMARNLALDYAFDQGYDYLVMLDDDATFPPELLRRLLSHRKDVVCALAYQRKPPHGICTFEVGEDGLLGAPMEAIEHTGLRKVDVNGLHVSCIRTSVVKRLRDYRDAQYPNGIRQYCGGFDNKVGEDFAFCFNLKKIGVPVYCDTDLISGHIGQSIVVDEAYKLAFQATKK